jgi:hypothetical protein
MVRGWLALARMAVAHLVSEGRKTVGDHDEATDDVLESVVEVRALLVHAEQLGHLLALLGKVALVVTLGAGQTNPRFGWEGQVE